MLFAVSLMGCDQLIGIEELSPQEVAPVSCETTEDCEGDLTCQPVSQVNGCSVEWTCQKPAEMCTRDLAVYCDCDGDEFKASGTGSCAGSKFDYRGFCDGEPDVTLHPWGKLN